MSSVTGPPSLLVIYSAPISSVQLAADSPGHSASHWLMCHLVKRPRPSTSPPHPQTPEQDSDHLPPPTPAAKAGRRQESVMKPFHFSPLLHLCREKANLTATREQAMKLQMSRFALRKQSRVLRTAAPSHGLGSPGIALLTQGSWTSSNQPNAPTWSPAGSLPFLLLKNRASMGMNVPPEDFSREGNTFAQT